MSYGDFIYLAALVADLKLPEFIAAGHKLESPEEARNLEKKDP